MVFTLSNKSDKFKFNIILKRNLKMNRGGRYNDQRQGYGNGNGNQGNY